VFLRSKQAPPKSGITIKANKERVVRCLFQIKQRFQNRIENEILIGIIIHSKSAKSSSRCQNDCI
jgi:hypothetical protein